MATPEAKFKGRIKRQMVNILHEFTDTHQKVLPPVSYRFNAGHAFGGGDRLDFDGVVRGQAFYAEIKSPTGSHKLTTRQKVTIDELRYAGAAVFVISCERSLEEFLTWFRLMVFGTHPSLVGGSQ